MSWRSRTIRRMTAHLSKRTEATLILILGLFFGTLFAVGMPYWQSPVTMNEALPVTAVYQECTPRYQKNDLRGVRLRFANHDQLWVEHPVATKPLLDKLYSIPAGTVCEILVHPHSDNTILSLTANGQEIIAFDAAVQQLASEGNAFRYLGIVCYVLAGYGPISLLLRRR